jgi:hypothetical protein
MSYLTINSTPAQMAMHIKTIANLLYGQMQALADVYDGATGEHKNAEDMLSDYSRAAYQRIQDIPTPDYNPERQLEGYENVQLDDPTPGVPFYDPRTGKEMKLTPTPHPGIVPMEEGPGGLPPTPDQTTPPEPD